MSLVSITFSIHSFNPFPLALAQEANNRYWRYHKGTIDTGKQYIRSKIESEIQLSYTDLYWTICNLNLETDRAFIEFVFANSNPENFFEPTTGLTLPGQLLEFKKARGTSLPLAKLQFLLDEGATLEWVNADIYSDDRRSDLPIPTFEEKVKEHHLENEAEVLAFCAEYRKTHS